MLMTCPKCGKLVQGMEGDQCPDCKIFLRPPNRTQPRDEDGSPAVSSPRTAERPVVAKVVTSREHSGYGWLVLFSVISFLSSAFFIYQGYDKLTNYYNSETLTNLNKNAYVGGDAYNYIINGNYATGFFVLALLCMVVGFGCLILRQLKINGDRLGE